MIFRPNFSIRLRARQATDNKLFRQHEYDWFGQDTWKVRRNLTLTLGLRYQLDGVPYEENANFSNLFGRSHCGPGDDDDRWPGNRATALCDGLFQHRARVGFSWDPKGDGKTAVRAAFGIFHDRVFGNLFGNARGNPPFEQDYNQFPLDTINGFYGGGNGPFPLPAPPETIPVPSSRYDPVDGCGALAPVLFDPHFRNAASNNWNFGIQRELPGNNVLDLAYVGSEGHHIYREMDPNPPDPALVQQLLAFCVIPKPMLFGRTSADDVSFSQSLLRGRLRLLCLSTRWPTMLCFSPSIRPQSATPSTTPCRRSLPIA